MGESIIWICSPTRWRYNMICFCTVIASLLVHFHSLQASAHHSRHPHGVGWQVRGGGRQRRREGRGPRQAQRRDVPHRSAQGGRCKMKPINAAGDSLQPNVLGRCASLESGPAPARSAQSARDGNSREWRGRAEPESGCKNGRVSRRDCKKRGALSNAISRSGALGVHNNTQARHP